MKVSILTIAIAALSASGVHSHGTEVRACITNAGNLRFYIEHWHSDLSSAGVAGTMDILPNHIPGAAKQVLFPHGHINNMLSANLPDCANGLPPTLVTDCSQTHNDWVYYDFPTSCNNPVSYTLLAGNTVYLTEGCSQLYPATYSDTFTDTSPPTITVDGQPCNGYTITKQSCKPLPVMFNVAAADDCDNNPSLSVSKQSGSVFPIGTTQVTATSTDQTGKTSTCTFDVNIVAIPTSSCAFGDPHIKTWSGELYDFHGVCDLVLLHNPEFGGGVGMDIHLRTKRTRQWSYVESGVLRIGEDTLEVKGKGEQTEHWVNGIKGNQLSKNVHLQQHIAGYPVMFRKTSPKSHEFAVHIDNDKIVFKTWNGFVRVDIQVTDFTNFENSLGLMGRYWTGAKVARDNSTIVENTEAFGQEWQVLQEEPKLFHNTEGPQAPRKCEIPNISEMRRRLAQSTITINEAEAACSRVDQQDFDVCVFDVMATNDKDFAGAY